MKKSCKHLVIGFIVGLAWLFLRFNPVCGLLLVISLMLIFEALQKMGLIRFKFYIIPVINKKKIREYKKETIKNSILDLVFGLLGFGIPYLICNIGA